MANGPGDRQVLSRLAPAALDGLAEQVAVDLARGAVVGILDRGTGMAPLRGPPAAPERPHGPAGGLAADRQPEPFGMAGIGGLLLSVSR
jgi:hypothetical protein